MKSIESKGTDFQLNRHSNGQQALFTTLQHPHRSSPFKMMLNVSMIKCFHEQIKCLPIVAMKILQKHNDSLSDDKRN